LFPSYLSFEASSGRFSNEPREHPDILFFSAFFSLDHPDLSYYIPFHVFKQPQNGVVI